MRDIEIYQNITQEKSGKDTHGSDIGLVMKETHEYQIGKYRAYSI